jgi:hypothetical protein
MDKEERHKDDCSISQCCVSDSFVCRRFEHHSSDSQKAENISVEEQMRGPGFPALLNREKEIRNSRGY